MARFEWKNAELDDDEVDSSPISEEDEEISEDEEEDLSDSGNDNY